MEQHRTEGTTKFVTDSEEKITKEMPVFYNPVMKRNRDLTLAVLLAMKAEGNDNPRIGLPMEASGIRAARIINELVSPGHLSPKLIALNDLSEHAIGYAKKNMQHYTFEHVQFTVNEANLFLRQSPGFDYIDIDPFGTPNPFLDSACQRIFRNGILAVTATDTSALAGTYPAATARKYWAAPSRTWVMHEVGLRILCRKVQLIAAQYEKALVPVLSVATDHYYRIFFRCVPSHAPVKDLLRQHRFLHVCKSCMQLAVSDANTGACAACGEQVSAAGPLWTGMLHDAAFVRHMRSQLAKLDAKTAKELDALLAVIEDECRLDTVGFVDLHELASLLKVQAPRTEFVLEKLGPHACRTHINGAAVKTDLPVQKVVEILRL
jgi:tRNA (guanine26-N2/guanine27-N2)-dimethyltransferase